MPNVLSKAEIEQFVTEGYVCLRDAFPREVAARGREFLWQHIGLDPEDPSGWTQKVVPLRETFEHGPFAEVVTPRVNAAFDDLMGEGRWNPNPKMGWWPITFPGFAKGPWQPPQEGWHVDGNFFHHHLTSKEQGLLPVFIFSDIEPGGGGTALSVGSHRHTARLLAAAEPAGISYQELGPLAEALPRDKMAEATSRAGDVVLLHPLMVHATSMNASKAVRFICNPGISLREPMQLQRADDDHSPVERAIIEALADPPSCP